MSDDTPNSITVPPSMPILGGTKITGATAILAIMLAGGIFWAYDQVKIRNQQFEKLFCKMDLAVWAQSFPKGQIDWSLLPPELYECVPNFKFK